VDESGDRFVLVYHFIGERASLLSSSPLANLIRVSQFHFTFASRYDFHFLPPQTEILEQIFLRTQILSSTTC
jgi:hypothetical protein